MFKIELKLNENSKKIQSITETEDAFYLIDGYFEITNNNQGFFQNIKPYDSTSFFNFDASYKLKTPIFAFVLELGECYLSKDSYNEFILTMDFIPFEYIFKNDGQNTHIYLHSISEDLWYDGEKIISSFDIPEKSSFIIPNKVFFESIKMGLNNFKCYVSVNFPNLMNNHFVKTSFINNFG